jgi:hypothetical protein
MIGLTNCEFRRPSRTIDRAYIATERRIGSVLMVRRLAAAG